MPQLDPSSFSSQLFWLTVCFVLLYILLARFLLPRIQSVIETRAGTIGSDIEQAKRMQSEAERIRDAYEQSVAKTKAQSKTLIAESRARLADTASQRLAELDAEIAQKLAESDAAIKAAKKNVQDKINPVAAELAGMIITTLMNRKTDAGDLDSAVSKFTKGETL